MSSEIVVNTNELLNSKQSLLDIVSRPDIEQILLSLNFDWETGSVSQESELFEILVDNAFVDQNQHEIKANRLGKLFYSRLALQFDEKNVSESEPKLYVAGYENIRHLTSGKNSAIFSASHRFLGSKVILKFVRPGASENIIESIRKLAGVSSDHAIVMPIDFFQSRVKDIFDRKVEVSCVVFPFVEGMHLRHFLIQENHHLNSHIVIAFIKQIGASLASLETINAYHGDLHERNIIVDQDSSSTIQFRLLDISFDAMGSLSNETCRNNDMSNFKRLIWRILSAQKSCIPKLSLKKYIGTKYYLAINRILSEKIQSFADIMAIIGTDEIYQSYLDSKSRFIAEKFNQPKTFRLQRYEEITDPSIAIKLFVPFPELMAKIEGFGNVFVSGNRGSGKSTYLASLAFFPKVETPAVDYSETYGIYFPCRQGEFRSLIPKRELEKQDAADCALRVVIVKIIRRTLETIASGIDAGVIVSAPDYSVLKSFLERFTPAPGIVSVGMDISSEMQNFVSTMVLAELDEVEYYIGGHNTKRSRVTEKDLIKFFEVIRKSFTEISTTRFHILFDDAGEPYIPRQIQCIINDLIITSNRTFCVKFSAEKYTFTFETSDGKALENGQDYYEHDISQLLFIGSGSKGLNRARLEDYFRKIVEQRLHYFNYKSTKINDYLGNEQLSADKLVNLLAHSRRDAYYCGWTTVWNIADRTPRNLLELVSEIFSVGNIERDTVPKVVKIRDQDRAIRSISEKRLQSLSQISGALSVRGKKTSLGRKMFEVTASIGSIFRQYLREERSKKRKRQHLAIERNDLTELDGDADHLLRKLVTFGVLDMSRSGFARDDLIKKPIYVLNRIYCPVFNISYRRDSHLRLSRKRFELLLTDPEEFMKIGTKRLKKARDADGENMDLFGYNIYD